MNIDKKLDWYSAHGTTFGGYSLKQIRNFGRFKPYRISRYQHNQLKYKRCYKLCKYWFNSNKKIGGVYT